jgi:hypothetical protein
MQLRRKGKCKDIAPKALQAEVLNTSMVPVSCSMSAIAQLSGADPSKYLLHP